MRRLKNKGRKVQMKSGREQELKYTCVHQRVVSGKQKNTRKKIKGRGKEKRTNKTLIIKPTRCTNFSNLFLEQNSTCFGQVFCPSSGVHCITATVICHTGYADCLLTGSRQQAVSTTRMTYTYCCVYSTRLPMMDRKPVPKHVEFYSKNKFEKLVHLFGFIIRIYHDAWSSECQRTNKTL